MSKYPVKIIDDQIKVLISFNFETRYLKNLEI